MRGVSELVSQLCSWFLSDDSKSLSQQLEGVDPDEELEALKKSISICDPEFWRDWEWVLNTSEEIELKQITKSTSAIEEELTNLRKAASALKLRPFIIQQAEQYMNSVESSEREELRKDTLDASKRSKIVDDIVNQFSTSWLLLIKENFFMNEPENVWETFLETYNTGPYSKNVVGHLKSLGFQASHGASTEGLTAHVLGDIVWSFCVALCNAIAQFLRMELYLYSLTILASHVLLIQQPLVNLWLQTLRHSRSGTSRAGILVEKWRKEDEEEQKRLKLIKERGTDAKYLDSRLKIIEDYTPDPESKRAVKLMLEEKLANLFHCRVPLVR